MLVATTGQGWAIDFQGLGYLGKTRNMCGTTIWYYICITVHYIAIWLGNECLAPSSALGTLRVPEAPQIETTEPRGAEISSLGKRDKSDFDLI